MHDTAKGPAGSFHTITRGDRVLGFIAVDSTVRGRARGGLRLAPDVRPEEIQAAARAMTLKYGALGLPQGGAKAGVLADPDAPAAERHERLAEFAHAAGGLLRDEVYVPDADMGTTATDIRRMMESIGASIAPREWRANRSGDYTARSCVGAAQALLERKGGSLRGARVAIEGFGKVGSVVGRLLFERGARIVAVSTSHGAIHDADGLDFERLARHAAERGGRFVLDEPGGLPRSALLELPVDLLLPCARFHGIHAENAPRVAARAICAGANDPVSPEAEALLEARGIPYPPDFLTNCGGVLGGTLEFAGVSYARISEVVEEYAYRRISDLLLRALRQGVTPRALARREALARHAALRAAAENPNAAQRLFAIGIEAYRRQWVPQRLVAWLAPRYLTSLAG